MICRVCEKYKTCDNPHCGNSSMIYCGEYEKSKQTNADRIRNMTDEKLAKYLAWLEDPQSCYVWELYGNTENISGWLEWLKQECES